jgi:hypothetical protein
MKKIATIFCLLATTALSAQKLEKIISVEEVTKTEAYLSSDAMEGRRVYTPAIDRAADFIAARFKEAGLQPLKGGDYFQPFAMLHVEPDQVQVTVGSISIPADSVAVLTSLENLTLGPSDSVQVIALDKDHTVTQVVNNFRRGSATNVLVLLDSLGISRLARYRRALGDHFTGPHSLVMIPWYGASPGAFSIHIHSTITQKPLKNVVGVLPGTSRPNEYVIFSAHYDHLGIGKPDAKGDSIYNGANDDASGTTAVLMLAKYFSARHDNARTLVFVAFTAEEIGEYGSQYFATQWNPDQVVAMFNIEMIGTTSKWGTHSAYITGFERSDFGKILQKNLEGTGFTFYPDPYPTQNLFYRSDNASLARVGVPAHTISTSKMDNEPYYHKQGDEISTLDMENMTQIIQSIALSSVGIISGTDTPTRVPSI